MDLSRESALLSWKRKSMGLFLEWWNSDLTLPLADCPALAKPWLPLWYSVNLSAKRRQVFYNSLIEMSWWGSNNLMMSARHLKLSNTNPLPEAALPPVFFILAKTSLPTCHRGQKPCRLPDWRLVSKTSVSLASVNLPAFSPESPSPPGQNHDFSLRLQ